MLYVADLSIICTLLKQCPTTIQIACDTPGVRCNDMYNIISINLSSRAYAGSISSNIGRLHTLTYLNLSHTGISGTVPDSICNLKRLEVLDLSATSFSSVPLCVADAPLGGPLVSLKSKDVGTLLSSERGKYFSSKYTSFRYSCDYLFRCTLWCE
jgi:hypothetical protein